MFTWICPKCGGEVPPSYSECPRCGPQTSQPAEPVESQQVPAVLPQPAVSLPAPQPVAKPELPVQAPPSAAAPPTRRSPTLVAGGTLLLIGGLLAFLYLFVLPRTHQAKTEPVALEAAKAARAKASSHPLAKNLEVTGVRMTDATQGHVRVHYVVVNHSGAELPPLEMQIALEAGGNTIMEFPAKLPSLKPFESKDLIASIRSDLKSYELPDWQMLRSRFEIAGQ